MFFYTTIYLGERALSHTVKIGILKIGCIGTLPLLEFLLDERAERADIDVRVVGSGSKLGPEQCREVAELTIRLDPSLVILAGPAQASPGLKDVRMALASKGIPTIIVSDNIPKKTIDEIENLGMGYIIVDADSMIGARREFLDPTEMAIYNADVIKVLSITGVFRFIVREIDRVIRSIRDGEEPDLPRIRLSRDDALEAAGFSNPYARAKAAVAYDVASRVSKINREACFKIEDWKVYVPLVASGHEMMRLAARMADEAREMEKSSDTVLREPHFKDGECGWKRMLIEKPRRYSG